MTYKKEFDAHAAYPAPANAAAGQWHADRRDGAVYLYYDDRLEIAVNVALKTFRPLLLMGPSGSGKSSLAKNVAQRLGRTYLEEVITSSTAYQDLFYRFDLVARLADAQADELQSDRYYLSPGVLWHAFDPESAFAVDAELRVGKKLSNTASAVPTSPSSQLKAKSPTDGVVILIDEIDKAEPEVPNNLLVALGSLQFNVPWLEPPVVANKGTPPLIFITSNNERDLPPAFLRRCIVLQLAAPGEQRLVEIAVAHFGKGSNVKQLAQGIASLMPTGKTEKTGAPGYIPSTAEYLDAVRACLELNVKPGDKVWETVRTVTWEKNATLGSSIHS